MKSNIFWFPIQSYTSFSLTSVPEFSGGFPLKNLAPSHYVTGFKWHKSASVFVLWHRLRENWTNIQTNEDIKKKFRIHPTNKSVSQSVYTVYNSHCCQSWYQGLFFYLIFFLNSSYYSHKSERQNELEVTLITAFWKSGEITNSKNTL